MTQLGVFQTDALTWDNVPRNSTWVVILSGQEFLKAVIWDSGGVPQNPYTCFIPHEVYCFSGGT